MTILVYARPWNEKQFLNLASKVWPDEKNVVCSEHPSVDKTGLHIDFYKAVSAGRKNKCHSNLSEAQIRDVIVRCRLLRSIETALARKLILSMEYSIEKALDKYLPKYVLSITVDSYILHLLLLACERKNIRFIGLVPTFVNGYFRITAAGERQQIRNVPIEESKFVLNKLNNVSYKPGFLASNSEEQKKKLKKLWARNVIKPLWFYLKRVCLRDFYNYHYHSTQLVSAKYWSILPKSYQGIIFENEKDIHCYNTGRPKVFIPLQMSPEATVDYWSIDSTWIDYEAKVISLIEKLSDKYDVFIKEHPNIVGYRTRGFYKKLKVLHTDNKCLLIAPEVNSNIVLQNTDAVLLCTGSVGFEAAIRGIPIYTDSKPFYLPVNLCNPISSLIKGDLHKKKKLSDDEKIELVDFLLKGMAQGVFVNDGSWSEDFNDQSEVADALRAYYEDK